MEEEKKKKNYALFLVSLMRIVGNAKGFLAGPFCLQFRYVWSISTQNILPPPLFFSLFALENVFFDSCRGKYFVIEFGIPFMNDLVQL